MSADDAVGLFAGPGGWAEGMRALGVSEFGIDNDGAACATARAAGHDRLLADIHELDPTETASGVAGVIASPPCPGFSAAGKGLGRLDFEMLLSRIGEIASGRDPRKVIDHARSVQHDDRSALTLEPLRWIIDLEPEWVALEQVPSVLPLWNAYADVLRQDGYNVWTGNVQAEQYGVPQTRKRAVLMAHHSRPVDQPTPTHSRYHPRSPLKFDGGVWRWVSMAEALGWVGGQHTLSTIAHQRAYDRSIPRTTAQPAPTIAFGNSAAAWSWQPAPAIEGEDAADITWPYERPSPTIVGSYHPEVVAAPGYRKAGDPPRQKTPGSVRVTVQEAAVLQSFRPDYPWQGSTSKQFQQVGNAVPPLLAEHIGAQLLAAIEVAA